MTVVMKLIALADGSPSPHEDNYVQSYTASGYMGRGKLRTTSDKARAKTWGSSRQALEAWRAVSKTHPTRMDGKPNRPLTAWTVEIEVL